MEGAGTITAVARDYESGNTLVSILMEDVPVQELQGLKSLGKLSVSLKKYRRKRSLDANSYYWCLVGKMASVTGHSAIRIHNTLLERYGVLDHMEDGSLIPFCIRDDIDHLEFSYPHLKPTQKTLGKDGRLYRWHYQLKGSSEFNTGEMSDLINGTISECREMDIETLPPVELERMMAAYEKKHSN